MTCTYPPRPKGAPSYQNASIGPCSIFEPTTQNELGPFGAQNPRPKFAASKVEVLGEPRKVGEGERHLQLRLRHYGTTLKAIAFGQAEWAEPILESGGNISICFQPTINRYRGNESVEMLLVDWQPGATVNGSLDAEVAAPS